MTLANSVTAKLSVAFVALATAFVLVAPAQAQMSEDEMQGEIDRLTSLIEQLTSSLGGGSDNTGVTVSSVCPYMWSRSLNMGASGMDVMKLQQFLNSNELTRVAASGVGSAGMETEYYGALTGAAVAKFQELNRDAILAPLGLVNSTTYFGPSTMAEANLQCASAPVVVDDVVDDVMDDVADDEEEEEDDSKTLGDDEGSIDSLSSESPDERNLEEGKLMGLFAFSADIEGDVEVNRVDVYLDSKDADSESGNADDYFEGAELWVDGEKVADLDVDDFDEDSYAKVDVVTGDSDEYRLRFSGLELVFADGDEPEFQVALEAVGNIDTSDLTEDWGFDYPSLRFVDGAGFSDDTGTDGAAVEEDFGFDAEEAAELNIDESDDNPDASVLDADDSSDTTIEDVFVFTIEEKEGVGVLVDELTITLDTSVAGLVDELVFNVDGTELSTESVPTSGTSNEIVFEDLGLEIDGDETVEVSIDVVVNALEDVVGGEGATFSVTLTSLDDVQDDSGYDEGDSELVISGEGLASETHEVRSTGISVEIDSAETSVQSEDGANNDTVDFTWDLTITAFGDDTVYITSLNGNVGSSTMAAAGDVDLTYTIEKSGGADLTDGGGTITSSADEVTGDDTAYGGAYNGETFFKITNEETFSITVSASNGTDSKQVQAYLSNIEWTTDIVTSATAQDGSTAEINSYTFELDSDSETGFKTIN